MKLWSKKNVCTPVKIVKAKLSKHCQTENIIANQQMKTEIEPCFCMRIDWIRFHISEDFSL